MSSSAMQFNDPYNYREDNSPLGMSASTLPGDGTQLTGSSIWERIATGLGLEPDHAAEYQRYVAAQNRAYERANVQSARAWDEYMDSTKYQRTKADLEAAGMNPWLMIQNGVSGGSAASSAGQGGSTRQSAKKSSEDLSSTVKNFALTLLATAKLISIL